MKLSGTERVDVANIGLMLISCCAAIIMPFEMFLLSYAILGPLHYLTEISWLHDRNYFSKGKYDGLILLIIGLIITLYFFNGTMGLGIEFPENLNGQLTYIALLGSLIFVLVKGTFARIAGLLLLIVTSQISEHFWVFFVVFLPTLIHVYIFTGLFMLYGAIKSQSKWGFLSVAVLALCPLILLNVLPDHSFIHATAYGQKNYKSFDLMIMTSLRQLMGVPVQPSQQAWYDVIFNSPKGILMARFIAFAYTYHYLNWFSKTEVIKWHKVPKMRLVGVVILWAISIGLYIKSYVLGLQWLFFLSFLHVLLEFPLNMVSIIGIGKYLQGRIFKPKVAG